MKMMIRYSLFGTCMAAAVVALVGNAAVGETKAPGILFSESFDDEHVVKRGWYDSAKVRLSGKDARAGGGCIEYEWAGGGKAVGSRGLRHLFEPTEVVYIRFYIKLSKGWGWSGRSYHPHMLHFLTTENPKYHGPARSHLTLYVEANGGRLRLGATDMQNSSARHGLTQGPLRGGYNGKLYDSKEALLTDANWHCVEAMFKLNSVDAKNDKWSADGELRGWFDGKLVIERTDVVFRTTDFPKMKFNQFLLAPYFGPGLLPHAQKLWIDELAVGTKRIGALPPSERRRAGAAAVGPRGPLGPDVPLTDVEKRRFARRLTVKGETAAAVQGACDRAAKEGIGVVFLPAGRYVFDKQLRVPGGLTVLGEGSKTICLAKDKHMHLFRVDGDGVRFTRLKLQGADTTTSTANNTFGIAVMGRQNIRIDHCEVLGFSYATNFGSEATVQVDHCHIHHNLGDGLGYGVAIYSGAYVLVTDNEFSQNRHSLASNGALDWSSPKRLGKYVHKPGVRKTHWEFIHNRVGSNDKSPYELCAVDTHPGMDGTFVVEKNLFENLRHGVGIRDGSGLIRSNTFRGLRTRTAFRAMMAVSISYGRHNNIPVEGCMPHNIEVKDNVFKVKEGVKFQKCRLGKAENISIDGKLVLDTKTDRRAPAIPRLRQMGEDGVLR